jgi:hypothetical protein
VHSAADQWDKDQRTSHQPEILKARFTLPKKYFFTFLVFKVAIVILLSKLLFLKKVWLMCSTLIFDPFLCRYAPNPMRMKVLWA